MFRISDIINRNDVRIITNDEVILLLEKSFKKRKEYERITKVINSAKIQNLDEVMIVLDVRSIKSTMKKYLDKKTSFTESQLCNAIKTWALKQGETIETKFEYRFDRDMYGDLYFYMFISLI